MRTVSNISNLSGAALETRCDSMLLGRLGSELALIYHDTLQAPLPAGFEALIRRLDQATRHDTRDDRDNDRGE